MTAPRILPVSSRFGRRLFALFALSAIVPVLIAGFLLLREFSHHSVVQQREELEATARGFGLTLFDRLDSTDSAFSALIHAASGPGDDDWLRGAAARLGGVARADLVTVADAARTRWLPDAAQRSALAEGHAVLSWRVDARSAVDPSLIRQTPGGAWLVLHLDVHRLWGDIADYAGDVVLQVRAVDGTVLAATPREPGENAGALPPFRPSQAGRAATGDDSWMLAAWEVFLRSHYASDSLWIAAYTPRAPVLGMLHGSQFTIAAVLVLAIFGATLIASSVIRRQARPVEQLLDGTRRISRREFGHQVEIDGDGEVAGLARAFNAMSLDLRHQFDALSTLADVDRQLQRSPDIEVILDRLLPSMTSILDAWSVSVLLINRDTPERARVYDHIANDPGPRPVRRISIDAAALRQACGRTAGHAHGVVGVTASELLEPLLNAGAAALELQALEHGGRLLGVLCIGHGSGQAEPPSAGIKVSDFADRLATVLANLEQSETLRHQAHYDSLTGLANRALFRERLQALLDQAQVTGRGGALLYIDLDQFKHVNDTSGHGVGDEFLRAIAHRLRAELPQDALPARLGGDEFAALLPGATSASASAQAGRLVAITARPVMIGGRELRSGASIGIAQFPDHGATIDEILMAGDIAMYRAKETGRGRAELFASSMRQQLQERAALESGLRQALANSEFLLAYQPIVRSDNGECCGVEALLRWPGNERGASPAEFVPVAEQCGLIVELGDWVLRTACRQFRELRQGGARLAYVSVNVSAHHLRQERLVETVSDCLRHNAMRADELQIEITESVLADGPATERTLRSLAESGVRLALDDFGTGYSSLSYLRDYPVHAIKIDRAFIRDLPDDPSACRLVEAMLAMAKAVGKHVVAEGIETLAQLHYLQRAGCGSVQGFLPGRPVAAVELLPRLLARQGSASTPEPERLSA
ncbi:MAG: putative bifunctional diguanylate cyclase/phosphodiesterase [Steroidobacteraceae bacterium]